MCTGWNTIIHDKVANNTVTDVTTINMPADLQNKVPEEGPVFMYAAWLPPGVHNFLIYCPVTKRAFVKEVIIQHN